MRGERTKRRIPARVFLSDRMALSKAADGTRGQGGRGPRRRISATMRETSSARVKPSSWPRIAAVVRDTFEGMGKGMAVIEDFAEAGLVFVATYDAGFDRDVSRNQKTQQMAISSQHFLYVFF